MMRSTSATLLFVLSAFHSAEAVRAEPSWSDLLEEQEISITVNQEDGTTRELTIWFVVVEGEGYVRTWGSSWHAEIERDPDIVLRIAGQEHLAQVSVVPEGALHTEINEAYRRKYGAMRALLLSPLPLFSGGWNVYRVEDRE